MRTKIIAHRGASRYAPENTLPAFELADEMKADGIELDVHLTKDKVPVIIHDESVNRTTNGTGYVRDYTFAELEKLDAGSWFSPKFTGTKILALEQLLEWAKPKKLCLNVELKNNRYDYKQLESIVYDLVQGFDILERTCFSTFNHTSIKRLHALNDQMQLALLTSKNIPDMIDYTREIGANALHVHQRMVKRRLVKEAKKNGMPLRGYTINKPSALIKTGRFHINGIITDVPDIARKYTNLFHVPFKKK